MAEEALARKKAVRRAQRSAITRAITQVEALVAAEAMDEARLKQKKDVLTEKKELVKTLDTDILGSVPDDELETEVEGADEVQERIMLALASIERALKPPIERPTPPREEDPSPPGTAPSRASPPREREGSRSPTGGSEGPPVDETPPTLRHPGPPSVPSRVKLPELTLSRFNGDLAKWMTFWDTFESTVHCRSDLSDVEKFSYLLSLLESPASEAVAGLALTSVNYTEAVSTLQKRYGNKQLIIGRHMDVLLNLESVGSQNDTRKLRRLYDSVETQMRGLRALGVDANSYGVLLSSTLLTKLPSEIRLIVSRGLGEDEMDLDRMLELFEGELSARERASCSTTQVDKKPSSSGRRPPTASTLFIPSNPTCVYCSQGHRSKACTAVPTAEARKQVLKQSGRCYICLRRNHISRTCRSSIRCSNCKGKHHDSICHTGEQKDRSRDESGSDTSVTNTTSTPTRVMFVDTHTRTLLQTATMTIRGMEVDVLCRVRAIMDSGSQRSYITSRVQQKMSLSTTALEVVEIKTFGSSEGTKQPCNVVRFQVITKDGLGLWISALVVPHICDIQQHSISEDVLNRHPHLMNLDLADEGQGETSMDVDVLVGADFYWALASGRVIRGRGDGPAAIETRVGWVLSGPIEKENTSLALDGTACLHVSTVTDTTAELNEVLKRFWNLESLGIRPVEESVQDKFVQRITFRDGRYEVRLPWRLDHTKLANNFKTCVRRLWGLHRRLRLDPDLCKAYDEILKGQLSGGIIEKVASEVVPPPGTHYLPHHPVVRKDKMTTKVRVVYDASCKNDHGAGLSLNQCLHVGPSFDQFILDILLRFRTHQIALIGDIEKAFLMVGVAPEDRDFLRFLWFDDPNRPEPELVTYRFTRVVFGVSSSPFLLNATIRHHIQQYNSIDPSFVLKFLRSVYVDDLTTGGDNVDYCYELYRKSKSRLAEGGFNLRKFQSNSCELRERIELKEGPGHLSTKDNGVHKVLGIHWDPGKDELLFDIRPVGHQLLELKSPTKRTIVGIAAKIYDPLGILSPVTITFKVFFRKLCKAKLDWDEPLSTELREVWQSLVVEMSQLDPIAIPRYLPRVGGRVGEGNVSARLVGFCDASKEAYAAVVYMRVIHGEGGSASLLSSKTRVSPMKDATIPRLELLSSLLLARLMRVIQEALEKEVQLEEPICYTDSMIALAWIQHDEREWKQFVENRVSEIRKLVTPKCWHHCPGVDNVADIPSRGVKPKELQDNMKLWLEGPEWLKGSLPHSVEAAESVVPEECFVEAKTKPSRGVVVLLSAIGEPETLIDSSRFSTFGRLRRVVTKVFRFIRLLKHPGATREMKEESIEDSNHAYRALIHIAQKSLINDSRFQTWKYQFEIFSDATSGILKCKGRLANADIPSDTKFPIILDKSHIITHLIVKECHEKCRHGGVNSTLAELRAKYWVIQGRQLVKRLIHGCVLCRRLQCQSYQTPAPPPLPPIRVNEKPPFSYTGIDFAGPLYTRESLSKESRKVWICLFMCCVTRAAHLELVTEMKTEAFLRCLKRFTSRRGFPIRILTDNAKTFKAAEKWLLKVMRHPTIKVHLQESGVSWQFNVERAPWWGGVFERMVQIAKRLLRKIVGTARLTFDELSTAIVEVEALVNSRPLTYISSSDLIEPLTPSHLLSGRRISVIPDEPEEEDTYDPTMESGAGNLTRRMKHLAKTIEHMWNRWRSEYLLELRNAHRNRNRRAGSASHPQVSVGDVVIVEDSVPRGFWKLAVVTELLTGRDGEIRAAAIRTHTKDGKLVRFNRPLQTLYPLEVREATPGPQLPSPEQLRGAVTHTEPVTEEAEIVKTNEQRPRRKAAVRAQEKITSWMKELTEVPMS